MLTLAEQGKFDNLVAALLSEILKRECGVDFSNIIDTKRAALPILSF